MRARICVAMLLMGIPFHAGMPATYVQTNYFDNGTGPMWAGQSNTANGFAFGYTNTGFTQGAQSGEVGGKFIRTDDPVGYTYFADTNLGGTFNYETAFSVTGRFAIINMVNTDGSFGLGWFSRSSTDYSFVGVNFAEPSGGGTTSFRAAAAYHGVASGEENISSIATFVTLSTNSSYWFAISFVPLAGVDGKGSVRAWFTNGSSSWSITQDVKTADYGAINLNSFGFVNTVAGSDDSTKYMHAYIDDIRYTSYLPEPTPIILMGLGGLVIAMMRAKKSQGHKDTRS